MKKSILVFMIFLFGIFLLGCNGDKSEAEADDEVIEFNEADFIMGVLESYASDSELEVEGRYAIGYMYSEAFSTDETGTLNNGSLQVNGRAFDPSDMGDETVLNGRTYTKSTTNGGNPDLELSNGSIIRGFYRNYFEPLYKDRSQYEYEEIDENKGRIIFEETTKKGNEENSKNIFVHEYIYIAFEGSKEDYVIEKGMIRKVIIKSYIDITNEMDDFIAAEFGSRYVLADEINQTLGDDFLKGIYSIEEFKADFK